MAKEKFCPSCKHSASAHDTEGCNDYDPATGKWCTCKKKYMDIMRG